MTTTLCCAVVKAGRIFSVRVDLNDRVCDLKAKIKENAPGLVYFDAHLLKIYLARDRDGWLNSQGAAIKALKKHQHPVQIQELMHDELLLEEAAKLNKDEYFGSDFTRTEGEIHLLVELPEDKQWDAMQEKDELFPWPVSWSYLQSLFTTAKRDKVE